MWNEMWFGEGTVVPCHLLLMNVKISTFMLTMSTFVNIHLKVLFSDLNPAKSLRPTPNIKEVTAF